MSDILQDHAPPSARTGWTRIAIGVAAGVVVWLLTESVEQKVWPATQPPMLGALAMVAMFVPFVLVGGLGELRGRTLTVWALGAAAVLAGLGAHDLARRQETGADPWISGELMAFAAAGLFIAHHLIAGSDADRRVIARFPRYFDLASRHAAQLALSAAFVGVFWIVLFLGGALFELIGIKAVNELIQKTWFAFPATAGMFAAAVHLTDVRPGLIRGIRTVALTLLSWLLPILTLLAGAFLLALPFTGLEPLWKTRSAAAILLGAAATLIVLINAAYQDGEPESPTPLALRIAGRTGGLLLAPMIGLAGYALWLRIGQHGLTPDRVVAVACAITGAVFAVGYGAAALRPGRWMRWVEKTAITAAFVALGLLLAIFSPLADPARLSVDNQMARLAVGKVAADKFDYRFLRFDGQRYGHAALLSLKAGGGVSGRRAAAALAQTDKWAEGETSAPETLPTRIDVWPKGQALPAGFLTTQWNRTSGPKPRCMLGEERCDATLLDLNGDQKAEVLIGQPWIVFVYAQGADGGWAAVGSYGFQGCPDADAMTRAFRRGELKVVESAWKDIEIGGRRFRMSPSADGCRPAPRFATPGDANVAVVVP